jgi:hypothetical protein
MSIFCKTLKTWLSRTLLGIIQKMIVDIL